MERGATDPSEGFVHRLKLAKRQGYGRVSFDLPRERVLVASNRRSNRRSIGRFDEGRTASPSLRESQTLPRGSAARPAEARWRPTSY
jgi:hypothetical protein